MAKITQFESQKQPRQSFKAPTLANATGLVLKTINKAANDHLDKKAKQAGIEEGEKAIKEGQDPNKIVKSPGTIYGEAFKDSARVAYTNKAILSYKEQVDQAYINNQDSIESFNKEARKIRDGIAKSTPSEWQSDILTRYDNYAQSRNTAVAQNVVNKKIEEDHLVNTQSLENSYVDLEKLAELGGENSEKEILDIVNQMVDTVKANYDNPTQIFDAKDVGTWVQNTTLAIVKGDILNDFNNAKTIGAKKELIEKLANGGWDTYYTEAEGLIKEKINKVIPGLELPKGMNNQQMASITNLLTSKFNIADNELRDQRKLKLDAAKYKLNKGETLNELEIATLTDLGVDGEVIDELTNNSDVNSIVNIKLGIDENGNAAYKKYDIEKLEGMIEEIENDLDTEPTGIAGTHQDTKEFIANNDILVLLEKQKQSLIQDLSLLSDSSTAMQIYEKNGISAIEIMNLAMSGNPETMKHHYRSALEIAKEHKMRISKIYGAEYLDMIPLPFDTNAVKENLESTDINKVALGISQVKAFEKDMDVSFINEIGLELDDPIFLAIELADDTRLSNKFLQAIANEATHDKIWTDWWKANAGSKHEDKTLLRAILDHSDFKDTKTGYTHMGTTEMNRAIGVFEKVIKNEMIEHNKSFDDAFDEAKKLYDKGFQTVTFNKGNDEKILRIPSSVAINSDGVEDFQAFLTDFDNNPLAWQVKCSPGLTLGQCEESFVQNAEPRLDGTVGYLIQEANEEYALPTQGGDGAQIIVGHGGSSKNELQTGLTFELDGRKRNDSVIKADAHPFWKSKTSLSVSNIKRKDGENLNTFKKEYVLIGAEYIMNNGGTDGHADDIASAIAEGQENQILTGDSGTKNINKFVITGIVQKALQTEGGFTQDEFKILSQFADFDKILNPDGRGNVRAGANLGNKQATKLQSLINTKWNEMKEQGGYTGKFNGQKLSPTLTLYLIYKDALSELEE